MIGDTDRSVLRAIMLTTVSEAGACLASETGGVCSSVDVTAMSKPQSRHHHGNDCVRG